MATSLSQAPQKIVVKPFFGSDIGTITNTINRFSRKGRQQIAISPPIRASGKEIGGRIFSVEANVFRLLKEGKDIPVDLKDKLFTGLNGAEVSQYGIEMRNEFLKGKFAIFPLEITKTTTEMAISEKLSEYVELKRQAHEDFARMKNDDARMHLWNSINALHQANEKRHKAILKCLPNCSESIKMFYPSIDSEKPLHIFLDCDSSDFLLLDKLQKASGDGWLQIGTPVFSASVPEHLRILNRLLKMVSTGHAFVPNKYPIDIISEDLNRYLAIH